MYKDLIHGIFKTTGLRIKKYEVSDDIKRNNYFLFKKLNSKYKDFTMIPFNLYSDNLEIVDKFKNIPGAVVECGVWRGGMIASIAELMGKDREYFLFDSFEGLPSAGSLDGKEATEWQGMKDSKHYYDNCAAEMQFAQQAMKLAGIDKPNIVKGWFNETVAKTKTGPISILRLDGDWYESTMTCLTELFPRVSDGGLILIDDYYFWEGCSKAVHDFLSMNKSSDRIHKTPGGVAYIIKNEKIKRPW